MHTLLSLVIAALSFADPNAGPSAAQPADAAPSPTSRPKPTLFARGRVSTGNGVSFSPDANTVYTAAPVADPAAPADYGHKRMTIFQQTRDGDNWSLPAVAPFSGVYNDYEAFVTKDGRRIYFMSSRPKPGTDKNWISQDIWYVERTADNQWSAAVHVPEASSDKYDGYPEVASDGALYFASDRDGTKGSVDLWRVRSTDGKPGPIENLAVLNTPDWESDPCLAPDGSFILFYRAPVDEGYRGCDLFIAYRDGDTFTTPVPLSRVNTLDGELGPCITPDGQTLIFQSGPRLVQVDLHAALEGTRETAQRPRSPDPQ